jgi:formate hydrogenlyase subunit 6/NADH:ubiquinone oxidoreductase subunit I
VQADGTGSFRVAEPEPRAEETALFGVRACDLRAIHVQDRVLLQGPHPDPHYQARREAALLVAVECTRSAETCFCAAVGGGPGVSDACDLVLTEMVEGGGPPWYLARAGSPRGDDLLSRLEAPFAGEEERRQAAAAVRAAGESQERDLPPGDLRKLFYPNHDNQLWHALAQRCLVCGNCTLVCPTCFCTEVSDHAGPGGERVERRRRWESCYTREFSHLPGGAVRQSASSRHRHWVVHKLAAWRDHFGELGCVGCGRCIVWCPAGIDLTQEAWAMQKADQREPEHA